MKSKTWADFFDNYNALLDENRLSSSLNKDAESISLDTKESQTSLATMLIQQMHIFRRVHFVSMKIKDVRTDGNVLDASELFRSKYEIAYPEVPQEIKSFWDMVDREISAPTKPFVSPDDYHRMISSELAQEIGRAKELLPSTEKDPLIQISRFIETHFRSDLPQLNPARAGNEIHAGFIQPLMIASCRLADCCAKKSSVHDVAYITNLWGQAAFGLFGHTEPSSLPKSVLLDSAQCIKIWQNSIDILATNPDAAKKPYPYSIYPFLLGSVFYRIDARVPGFNADEFISKALKFVGMHATRLKAATVVLATLEDMCRLDGIVGLYNKGLISALGDALNKCDQHYRKVYAERPYLCPVDMFYWFLVGGRELDASCINNLGLGLHELLREDHILGNRLHDAPHSRHRWNQFCLKIIEMADKDGADELSENIFLLLLLRNAIDFSSIEPWPEVWNVAQKLSHSMSQDVSATVAYACESTCLIGKEQDIEPFILARYDKLLRTFGKSSIRPHPVNVEPFSQITPSLIKALIRGKESKTVEFKETLKCDSETGNANKNLIISCVEAIAAFQNSEGGVLLIGVNDAGDVTGLERDMKHIKTEDEFKRFLQDGVSARLGTMACRQMGITFVEVDGRKVCAVECTPCNWPVYFKHDKKEAFLIRLDGQNRGLNPSEIFQYVSTRFDKGT